MAYETHLAQADTALGHNNPTLSFNLSGNGDFNPGLRFIDLMNSMRPWIGHEGKGWGGMTTAELRDGGYLDDDGWVKEIPEGYGRVGNIWVWDKMEDDAIQNSGRYVVEYEGEGILKVRGGVEIVSEEPGRIVFDNADAKTFSVEILETDPAGNGNYIKNISVVAEEHVALHEAGALFNPDWLELVQDSRELRFMDWQRTNNSEMVSWDEMASANGPRSDVGTPIEYMVRLANEAGIDPWFTMPHLADENYIREFATYVRDNLDPALKVKVEYSNEVWNFSFQQAKYMATQSEAEWGNAAHMDYHVKKAVETALIWEDVFAETDNGPELINVLGAQTGNKSLITRLLEPKQWIANEPDSYVDPKTVFEELAVTSYFGSSTVSNAEMRAELISMIKDPDVDATAWLAEKLMDPDYKGSIPGAALKLADSKELAEAAGLDLVLYEGGQHVHHTFSIRDLTEQDVDILTDFMTGFVRSEQMGDLYRELWDSWAEHGDGAFMQFGDVYNPGKFGSWGLYDALNDENPRATALNDLNASSEPWWDGATGGEQYQQGVIAEGTADGEIMVGTSQEDYLLGMGGDDIFAAGAGNDGINGGDGTDKAVFSGDISNYTVQREGEGYRVVGLDGSDFVINVEELAFGNYDLVMLGDLVENADGTLQLPDTNAPLFPDTDPEPKPDTDPEPKPDTDPEPEGPKDQAAIGKVFNAADYETVNVASVGGFEEGVTIQLINPNSTLGKLLDLSGEDNAPSYLSYVTGSEDPTAAFIAALNRAAEFGPEAIQELALNGAAGAIITNAPEVVATENDDIFRGSGWDDHVQGGNGADQLDGFKGYDTLLGGNGNDTINGGFGNDILRGGAGDDRVYGGDDNDVVSGGSGDDALFGNNGNDRISGDNGDDRLHGHAGDDVLNGGAGNDFLRGGSGGDLFVFSKNDGQDVIRDYEEGDSILLTSFLAADTTVEESASMHDGHLSLSNGEDRITLLGLDMNDLDWVSDSIF